MDGNIAVAWDETDSIPQGTVVYLDGSGEIISHVPTLSLALKPFNAVTMVLCRKDYDEMIEFMNANNIKEVEEARH